MSKKANPREKPRLTLLIDSLAAGGAQTQILRLAEGLRETWRVRVAWYNQSAQFFQVPAGVEAVPLQRSHRRDPRFMRQMLQLVSRRETDLVHAWLPAPSLYATLAACKPGSAPVLTAVRSSPSLFHNDPMQGRLSVATSWLAQATTSNSRESIAWLAARGVPQRKLHFIGNALAPAIAERRTSSATEQAALLVQLGLDPTVRPIVSLGRFDAYKNQDGLVRALGLVKQAGVAVPPLLLAGFLEDTQRVAHVRQLAQQLALDVRIVPAVTDVATLLEAARFSVLASRSEGTPNVLLEALGLGTPVVATRVGEVPDLVRDGETGVLCLPESDAALAKALREALEMTPERAAQMGRLARVDMLARFHATAIVRQYAELYTAVLART